MQHPELVLHCGYLPVGRKGTHPSSYPFLVGSTLIYLPIGLESPLYLSILSLSLSLFPLPSPSLVLTRSEYLSCRRRGWPLRGGGLLIQRVRHSTRRPVLGALPLLRLC